MEEVAFPALLERRRDLAGGFVCVDPTGWHLERITRVAMRATENGARLVLYAPLTAQTCRHVEAAVSATTPEVVLADADDSVLALRAVLERDIASVPALVLADLIGRLVHMPDPLGARLASYLAWAPIPATVADVCDALGYSRKSMRTRLQAAGLSSTVVVLDVTRVARACHHLFGGSPVSDAARLARIGSERAMRDAFRRRIGATPSEVRFEWAAEDVARVLARNATLGRD